MIIDLMLSFSHSQARSKAVLLTLGSLVVIETIVIHLLLMHYSWLLAIVVSLVSISALIWLVDDYEAMGRLHSEVTHDALLLRIGRRTAEKIPKHLLKSVCKPTWKDVPDEPDRLYLNITKPAEPNKLLTFHKPVAIKLPGGLRKQVTRFALFVDEPDQFIGSLQDS